MTFKEFWVKVKDVLAWILIGIGTAILAILGIRKGKANKQTKKNEEAINDIEDEKKDIKKEIEDINNTVSEAEKVIEKAKEETKKSESVSEDIKSQVEKNESILEKYKRWKRLL